jgi:hypothetical protein
MQPAITIASIAAIADRRTRLAELDEAPSSEGAFILTAFHLQQEPIAAGLVLGLPDDVEMN